MATSLSARLAAQLYGAQRRRQGAMHLRSLPGDVLRVLLCQHVPPLGIISLPRLPCLLLPTRCVRTCSMCDGDISARTLVCVHVRVAACVRLCSVLVVCAMWCLSGGKCGVYGWMRMRE